MPSKESSSVQVYESVNEVARVAAQDAIETLSRAVATNGAAVWVLAGGTSPMLAYAEIKDKYTQALGWSKVTVLIGDERIVPLSDKDSNWGSIIPMLTEGSSIDSVRQIVPRPERGEVDAADAYNAAVQDMYFDLVWVGVGEDGHTLSLFPNNPAYTTPTSLSVLPVYDSPKAPSTRITLSVSALKRARKLVIFAVGEAKKAALKRAKIDQDLPIAKVASIVGLAGGQVVWLYDRAAQSL